MTSGHSARNRTRVWLVASLAALSVFGMLVHNAREFGIPSVLASTNGELPITVVWVAVFLVW